VDRFGKSNPVLTIVKDSIVVVEEIKTGNPHVGGMMGNLGDTNTSLFISWEPLISWDGELVTMNIESDVLNLLVLLFSALATSKRIMHFLAFHSLEGNLGNRVEISIWHHHQWGTSVSNNLLHTDLNWNATNSGVRESQLPELITVKWVPFEVTLSEFSEIISSHLKWWLSFDIDEHGEHVLLDGFSLEKGWHKELNGLIK